MNPYWEISFPCEISNAYELNFFPICIQNGLKFVEKNFEQNWNSDL